MIHLDTNFLILATSPGNPQDVQLRTWLAAGERVRIDAIVWAEFLCGPLTSAQLSAAQALFPNPEPFTATDAAQAATLFNLAGRRRGSLTDCMIAAVCVRAGASLATANVADFRHFAGVGLKLA